ncbi:peptidoglycan-binding protein [Streptomyces sp. NPDC053792]|uniref:peptidoglycan-binding protein n=1 Tax=Streptomyces sp. NPDC053792 TaxID=3365716 RepID=UPI0037D6BDEB
MGNGPEAPTSVDEAWEQAGTPQDAEPKASGPGNALARRRRLLGAVTAAAVLVSGLGIVAARVIKSPAQAAADTAAPPPSVITAAVEHRVLEEAVILRGSVHASQTVEISAAVSGGAGGAPVITKMNVGAGDTFRSGRVLMEVSGRPVIALKGSVPVYRDLKPGAEGEDVAQLQSALRERGHDTGGDRSGLFGPGTKAALSAFYRSVGYDALPAEDGGEEELTGAQEAVTEATRRIEDIQAAARGAQGTRGGAEADGKGTASTAGGAGLGDLGDSAVELRRAREDLAKAQDRLDRVKAKTGPMLPASEVVYLKGFPARVDSVSAGVGSKAQGNALTVSAGVLVVEGFLQKHQRGLVRPGQPVEIFSEWEGKSARATVRSVATGLARPQPAAGAGEGVPDKSAAQGYAMVVAPDKPLDASMAGQDVRLTVQTAATDGAVLVVPVTAISAGADGRTAVTVLRADGKRLRVPVSTGGTGDGYVEVRPAREGELSAGDQVITGVAAGAGADAGAASTGVGAS